MLENTSSTYPETMFSKRLEHRCKEKLFWGRFAETLLSSPYIITENALQKYCGLVHCSCREHILAAVIFKVSHKSSNGIVQLNSLFDVELPAVYFRH